MLLGLDQNSFCGWIILNVISRKADSVKWIQQKTENRISRGLFSELLKEKSRLEIVLVSNEHFALFIVERSRFLFAAVSENVTQLQRRLD